MKISAIVPAYNEERELAASLRSIRAATREWERRGWASELIVCDNNSSDRTGEIAREAGATVVFEPINQIARARNAGAARATGDWLLFVDADSHPSPELCADVARAIESGRPVAGGSTITFHEDEHRRSLRVVAGGWNAWSRVTKWMAGSFIFCEAAAFRELGGFSFRFYAAEEIDFSRRVKRLARSRGRSIVILSQHPLVTSARRATLYTWREMLSFMVKTIVRTGRTLRSVDDCYPWYDGRR